jgi:predicted O-methyltransferase YrrM
LSRDGWALSKTRGKLVIVEIDVGWYRQAVANFKEARVDEYINVRLADTRQVVGNPSGPL